MYEILDEPSEEEIERMQRALAENFIDYMIMEYVNNGRITAKARESIDQDHFNAIVNEYIGYHYSDYDDQVDGFSSVDERDVFEETLGDAIGINGFMLEPIR